VTLLLGTFRGSPLRSLGMVLALLYALVLAAAAIVGFAALRDLTPDIARAVIVALGSLVVTAFLVLPLAFGADDQLDPRRFALLGIRPARLSLGLAVAAFVSVPVLLVSVLAVAQIITWSRGSASTVLAIVSAVILVPTCVLASRVSSGIAATLLASRRARSISGIVLMFAAAILAPLAAIVATADAESQALPVLRRLAAVLGWTPLGAVWSVPADAANGNLDNALAKLAIAVGFLVVLALAWRVLVSVMLRRRDREVATRRYSGLGWFERLPATPRGAIAARSLSYWARDARYRVAVAAIPVVPIVMVAALVIGGVPAVVIAWIPVPVMCLFLAWLPHNDLAHDSTAFWVHVSASTRGTDDRWGRLVPALGLGVPLVLVGSLVTAIIVDDWVLLPGLIGLSACVLLAGLGVSSVASAGYPYPAVHPGDSPFAQPQAAGSSGSTVQAFSLIITILLASPLVALVVLGAVSDPFWYLVALGAGPVLGLLVLVLGVHWGGSIIARRAPELLAFTLQN
jgi:ABC-2 type transport system permease protein